MKLSIELDLLGNFLYIGLIFHYIILKFYSFLYSEVQACNDTRKLNCGIENALPINPEDISLTQPYRNIQFQNRNNVIRTLAQMDNRIPLRFVSENY